MNPLRHPRHGALCGLLTTVAAALITAWCLLSDLDASAKASQLGAMITLVAAVSPLLRAHPRCRAETQDGEDAAVANVARSAT